MSRKRAVAPLPDAIPPPPQPVSEENVAAKFVFHLYTGFQSRILCSDTGVSARGHVQVIAPLDHPALCPTCLQERTKLAAGTTNQKGSHISPTADIGAVMVPR